MFEFFKEKLSTPKKEKEEKKAARERFIRMGMMFLRESPFIAKEFFKKAGLSEKEIQSRLELAKAKAEKQSSESKKKMELTPEDKGKLAELGASHIEDDPYSAAIYLQAAGFSKDDVRPLFELAELLKKNKEKQNQEPKKEIELTPEQKIRLQQFGLTCVDKNQQDVAKICFQKAGLLDEKIDSLLNLNCLDADKEKERLEAELAKMRSNK